MRKQSSRIIAIVAVGFFAFISPLRAAETGFIATACSHDGTGTITVNNGATESFQVFFQINSDPVTQKTANPGDVLHFPCHLQTGLLTGVVEAVIDEIPNDSDADDVSSLVDTKCFCIQ